MQKRNYQKELDRLLEQQAKEGTVPSLLLHSCCAPCSSYVLQYLSEHFHITVCYYNPNISLREEFEKRVQEQARLIASMPLKHPVSLVVPDYVPEEFYVVAKGLEKEPEGGKRCEQCFRLRLGYSARMAAEGGFDYFTTTLSISPLKDAELLNRIGEELAAEVGVRYLNSDFKKKDGYRQSVQLSKEYDLYRQDYCGCVFSKREAATQNE